MSKKRQANRAKKRKRNKRIAQARKDGMKTYTGQKHLSHRKFTDAQLANSICPYVLGSFQKQEDFELAIREIAEATAVEDKGLPLPRPVFILMCKPLLETPQNNMNTVFTIFQKYSRFTLPVIILFTPEKFIPGGIDDKDKKEIAALINYVLLKSFSEPSFFEDMQAQLIEKLQFRAEVENISESEVEDFYNHLQLLRNFKSHAITTLTRIGDNR